MTSPPDEPRIECAIPVLPVSDLAASVEFYKALGFTLDWGNVDGGVVCSVSRDGRPIMLMKHSNPVPTWVWIGVADESVLEQLRSRATKVVQEPKNFSWAYEVKLEDIDGNILWVGTEPRKHLPYEDEE